MLLLTLDERSREPKSRQIIRQIIALIENETLRPGDLLPSTRKLAESLAIHRSTVALAYQELWALGYVDLRTGARPQVRTRIPLVTEGRHASEDLVDWSATASPASNGVLAAFRRSRPLVRQVSDAGIIDFSSLEMDRRLFPTEAFRSCLARVLRDHGNSLLGYGDPAGYLPLREYVAQRLHSHGVSVTADEILITSGAQQALDLVFRMVAAPGRTVAVESPTYDCVLPLLLFNGLRPVEVPMRPHGMDLSVLAEVLARDQPVLVYTMPSFQNPTGVSTDQAHREQLLALCERHHVPILEDAFDEEMKYFGRVVMPIKSMDRHQSVIYCGTFSKVLFPGVRIGWIAAAGECIARLVAIRRFSELSPNTVLQAAIHEFCENGHYDHHVSRMHRVFRRRMRALTGALRKQVSPDWATWSEPAGGYLAWLELSPAPGTAVDWQTLFSSQGVKVALGSSFFPSEPSSTYIRLSIAGLDEAEIVAGVQRLAASLRIVHGEGCQP